MTNAGSTVSVRTSAWSKLKMHLAVMGVVAASVPAAWGAGANIQVTNVAAGTAAFSRAGSVTTVVTGGQNTIINYSRMNVGAGETLRFVQPSASSRVLNRIDSAEPTKIDGNLTSNGIVYLVNPAGVMFGQGAVINVGQIYAAASHITDANFLAGQNQFTNGAGRVENWGTIEASQVHLVGGSIANFGKIVTGAQGIVTMTAGKDVYIGTVDNAAGSPRILVKVSGGGASQDATAVTNAGRIESGTIRLGAGDVYAAGIYNSGTLKGKAITLDSRANTNITDGVVDASGGAGKGGRIELLGDKVGVFGGTVTASGNAGGGDVLVGADVQGTGVEHPASFTYVGQGATIEARSGATGFGGRVIV